MAVCSQTSLASMVSEIDISAVISALDAYCEPEALQTFMESQVLPCLGHLRLITASHLSFLYRHYASVAGSFVTPLALAEGSVTHLRARIRELRSSTTQLRHSCAMLRASGASPDTIHPLESLLTSHDLRVEALLTELHTRLEVHHHILVQYEGAEADVRSLTHYETVHVEGARQLLYSIRAFITSYWPLS